jgi:hypothetical protein
MHSPVKKVQRKRGWIEVSCCKPECGGTAMAILAVPVPTALIQSKKVGSSALQIKLRSCTADQSTQAQ